jgi:polygalacturonase
VSNQKSGTFCSVSPTRRHFLKATGGAGVLRYSPVLGYSPKLCSEPGAGSWEQAAAIRARIRTPVFPKRDFEITRYGAIGDRVKDSTEALARAIAACNEAGGGRVIVPAGVWLTGAIHLKSNVELHLSRGATLRFSRDPRQYLPLVYTRWEGTESLNYSPFLYANGQNNIAITGPGTLDGQADCEHWWPWNGRTNCGWSKGQPSQDAARKTLMQMGAQDVPLQDRKFGEGFYLRPSFIQPVRSRNVLIEGVSIVNSPMYEINPLMCASVTVRDVKISSHGPNNDGCDPDSSTDVLIENCVFDTGDDCIAIKSGRNRDGRRLAMPTENVVIRNCRMKDGHGGVTIGSEMSGGVRNVFAENCTLDSPHLNQALRFKTNAMRGGTIENVFVRNFTIGQVADAILQIDFFYEEGPNGPERPVVRNIDIRNVTAQKAKFALFVRGFPSAPVRDLRLENCHFSDVSNQNVLENVEGLKFADVTINGKEANA